MIPNLTGPVPDVKLEGLYGSRADHADAWAHAVDAMVRDRWLLPADAAALHAAPE